MGHCISVYLIHKSEIRNEKIKYIIDGKDTDVGFYLSNKIYITTPNNNSIFTELGSDILATEHISNFKEWGKDKTIAKISTDYFGGSGNQSAKLFINGESVYDKSDEYDWSEKPINTVLKMMGVISSPNMDEFDTIGLYKYRSNDDFNKIENT
jgi:hypothetical protein